MATTFLCDTNILGELTRPQPNEGVVRWAQGVRSVSLSAITVEEITFGLTWKPNPRIRLWLEDFFQTYCEILPVTPEIAERAGDLRGRLRSGGETRSQADMLIAATAKIHSLTLVTRNTRDFEGCDLSPLNPFE